MTALTNPHGNCICRQCCHKDALVQHAVYMLWFMWLLRVTPFDTSSFSEVKKLLNDSSDVISANSLLGADLLFRFLALVFNGVQVQIPSGLTSEQFKQLLELIKNELPVGTRIHVDEIVQEDEGSLVVPYVIATNDGRPISDIVIAVEDLTGEKTVLYALSA